MSLFSFSWSFLFLQGWWNIKKAIEPTNIEYWNVKGKRTRFLVARVNGKVQARKKWSRNFNKTDARKVFKQNNTFDKDIKKTFLGDKGNYEVKINVRSDTKFQFKTDKNGNKVNIRKRVLNIKRIRKGQYQYVVRAILKGGTERTGRSKPHNTDYPKHLAREEAYNNLFKIVISNKTDDVDEGREYAERFISNIHEQVVYYKLPSK